MKKVRLSTLGSLIDRNKEVPQQRISFTLTSSGWKRVAECNANGAFGTLSIVAGSILNTGVLLVFGVGYSSPIVFKALTELPGDNRFNRGRILTKPGNNSYIEIHHNTTASIPYQLVLGNTGNTNLITPIVGSIPEGYVATEFVF